MYSKASHFSKSILCKNKPILLHKIQVCEGENTISTKSGEKETDNNQVNDEEKGGGEKKQENMIGRD
jgi:hypothetical protein